MDKISPVVRSSPCRTSGSHVWNGASPTFRARAIVIIATGRGWAICWISHCPESQAFIVLANKSIAAAAA